jgi:restriction system protein
MDEKMHQELMSWRASLLGEVGELESQLQQIRSAISEKREKVTAIDRLVGHTEPESPRIEEVVDLFSEGVFTPTKAYWRPLLQTLVELGGRGRREQIIEQVGQKMQDILRPADYEKLPQSSFIRWENRVAWQASNMRREGYIKNNSPRGIWEITDAGRKWLEENS